jgi:predicted nucleotidyltransferase component of viral defense system
VAFHDIYRRQVTLLLQAIPHVAGEACFALKGGTAINLFVRDLPRLSVDIDLTYLPVAERTVSLHEIDSALKRIGERIKAANDRVTITGSAPKNERFINKLVVRAAQRIQIKIEVSPVLRGCVYEPQVMRVSEKVEGQFGFAEMNVLSLDDLNAGKLGATLDRQHPRDLFDVNLLLDSEGISDGLREAFIVYLIASDHPPQRLLS